MNDFWRTKTLDDMTREEWESLCDGCAQCCRVKLEDEGTGDVAITAVVCKLLDLNTCRCRDYERRFTLVPDCMPLDPDQARRLSWLPATCAYRLVAAGRDLPEWHPLRTGDPDSVHRARVSVRADAVPEGVVPADELEYHVVRWVRNPASSKTRG
jgi:uncharacterized protein